MTPSSEDIHEAVVCDLGRPNAKELSKREPSASQTQMRQRTNCVKIIRAQEIKEKNKSEINT